jgi:hypothetical protein
MTNMSRLDKTTELLVKVSIACAFLFLAGVPSAAAQEPPEQPEESQEIQPAVPEENAVLPDGTTIAERKAYAAKALGTSLINPQAFNATNWFVSGLLAVGTDTPFQELTVETASFPFLRINLTTAGGGNAGINIATPSTDNFIYSPGPTGDLLFLVGSTTHSMQLTTGRVGIANTNPLSRLHVGVGTLAPLTSGSALLVEEAPATSMVLKSTSGTESFFYQDAVNGLFGTASTTPMGIRTNNVNRVWITESGLVGIGTTSPTQALHVIGNIVASGTKSFAQDDPTDSTKQIVYAALEGGEAGTYTRGTATLVNGAAVIDLPEHFGRVTEESGLTVQLTPRGEWLQLFVVQLSPTKLVVKEASHRKGHFDFQVQGVRRGYADYQVVRDKTLASK